MNILGKSKLRNALLKLYFFHPEKKYYIRQLERIMKKPAAYVRKELLNLQDQGLLMSEFQGKERFFQLNKNYPLYEEVKKVVAKTIGLEAMLQKKLQKISRIESAFVFGSYAKGKEDEKSDIDLMIVGSPDEDKLIEVILKLEKKVDREINYHIYKKEEFDKKSKNHSSFIASIMRNPKIFIIGHEKQM
jgi:predicted nucleotidyltransferase